MELFSREHRPKLVTLITVFIMMFIMVLLIMLLIMFIKVFIMETTWMLIMETTFVKLH